MSRHAGNISFDNFFNPKTDPERDISSALLTTPEFQRNYIWDITKIDLLIDSIINNDNSYYIGSIVTISGEMGSNSRDLLVDGQQRLVTLSLLCSVLIDYTQNNEDKIKLNKVLFNDLFARISFSRNNLNELYIRLIKGEYQGSGLDLDDSQAILLNNIVHIDKKLRKIPQNNIDALVKKIFSLEFVVIKCMSVDDAFQLFEGLNSTGVSLSPLELTKSSILGAIKRLDQSKLEEAFQLWSKTENLFEQDNIDWFDKFLRQQLFDTVGYINSREILSVIKKNKIDNKNVGDMINYLEVLNSEAQIYLSLRKVRFYKEGLFTNISNTNWDKIIKYIDILSRLNLDQVYGLLLILIKYGKSQEDYFTGRGDTFKGHLEKILAFCLIAKYTKISPSSYERKFANLCKEVVGKNYADFKVIMENFFSNLKSDVENSKEVFTKLFIEKFNYSKDGEFSRYVLNDYLLSVGKGSDQKISGEHIVPENDQTKWINIIDKKEILNYVNNIGNLTLIDEDINSAENFKTEKFDDKYINGYKRSRYTVNVRLKKEWGRYFNSVDVINKAIIPRGMKIAGILYDKYINTL